MADWPLSRVLLMDESRYPWFILVPRVADVTELVQLSATQQQQLLLESNQLSRFLQTEFKAHKLNLAALGNVVAQLHIHHIARFEDDAAWPAPVWGKFPPAAYDNETIIRIRHQFEQYFLD